LFLLRQPIRSSVANNGHDKSLLSDNRHSQEHQK
jgi:hypothetical protein